MSTTIRPGAIRLTTGTTPAAESSYRITSIDFLRGLVMVIMALDHTRDFFHRTAFSDDPLNLATTTPQLFFTRFVTHYCAPVFVFLAGASAWFQGKRKSPAELGAFLMKRGAWLLIVEVVIMALALTFDPLYHYLILQTLWAIGWSMIALGLAVRLPYRAVLTMGLVIVLGHNALDFYEAGKTTFPVWYQFLHHPGVVSWAPGRFAEIAYPVLPWTGLMFLGYCFGRMFTDLDRLTRARYLTTLGVGLLVLFVLLRATNAYGDAQHWSVQPDGLFTFLSFLNVVKYPPSLLYMCITIGPALLLLRNERLGSGRIGKIISVYGQVPFFYYVLHFYVLHTLTALFFLGRGHTLADAIHVTKSPTFVWPNEGYDLPVVYAVWIATVAALYPLCKWFAGYKKTHKQWWIHYL